jgi:hypothetical protein
VRIRQLPRIPCLCLPDVSDKSSHRIDDDGKLALFIKLLLLLLSYEVEVSTIGDMTPVRVVPV